MSPVFFILRGPSINKGIYVSKSDYFGIALKHTFLANPYRELRQREAVLYRTNPCKQGQDFPHCIHYNEYIQED